MVKRCIGIDVGSSYLCAVQILRIGKAFCIEKVLNAQAQQGTDSPSDTLRTLVRKYGFNRRAAVAISVPNDAVFFRTLQTDSVGLEQIRRSGSLALEYDFPIEPDEIVVQPCSSRQVSDEKYSVLTAAVARESLHETRDILLRAKLRPDLIEATVFAIHSTVALNHPEINTGVAIIAHIAESYMTLTVTQNKSILIVRHFPIAHSSDNNTDSVRKQVGEVLSREVGIIWQKLFEADIEQDTRMYLVTGNGDAEGLKAAFEENLHCQTTIVNPYARVLLKHRHHSQVNISVAEGLALRTLVPEKTSGINFLKADNANTKPTFNLKKEFVICAVLVAAIAVVSLIGLSMRLSHLEAEYAQVKDEIGEIFQRTLPEEKNIVNPLAQLEQKLQSLQRDYALVGPISGGDTGALGILHAVTISTPPEANISLDDMLITTESVRLTGTSQSFESVYNWQQILLDARQFSTVDVQDIRREPKSERIRFTVLASFAMKERE